MTSPESLPTLTLVALVIAPCVFFVESFRVLPFAAELRKLTSNSAKSIAVIHSPKISDHWKGQIIPHYARRIMQSSCLLGLFLLLCTTAYCLASLAAGYVFSSDLVQSFNVFLQLKTQISALVVGSLYAVIRSRVASFSQNRNTDYSKSSALLHRLALNYRFIREIAFDLDSASHKKGITSHSPEPPVFVAGLARGGTTILLEALYSTEYFTTLTYRNMPFVTAPSLWPKISTRFYRFAKKQERAHGDRLEVNFDSPEAFEEVFWLTFSEEKYVRTNSIIFQNRDNELEDKYKRYVYSVLASSCNIRQSTRYLAKNNNNLLRIELIKGAFPEATILVPFRNPLDHTNSLLKQHRRFCTIHQETPFSRDYMDWLGHHEFGENIKPFEVDSTYQNSVRQLAFSIDFWLKYWADLYAKLLRDHSRQVVFFDYDSLCSTPESQLGKLASVLNLPPEKLSAFASSILPARSYNHTHSAREESLSHAWEVHRKLIEVSL